LYQLRGSIQVVCDHLAVMHCAQLPGAIGGRDMFRASAAAIYAVLLGPFEGALVGQTLVVIPDGDLWRVPFSALVTGEGAFLIEQACVQLSVTLCSLLCDEVEQQQCQVPHASATLYVEVISGPATVLSDEQLQALSSSTHVMHAGADSKNATTDTGPATSPKALHIEFRLAAVGPSGQAALLDGPALAMDDGLAAVTLGPTTLGRCGLAGPLNLAVGVQAAGVPVVFPRWQLPGAAAAASCTALLARFYRELPLIDKRHAHQAANALRIAKLSLLYSGKDSTCAHPLYWAGYDVVE